MADILGTIVASILDYKTINSGRDGCDPLHSEYAPCDGRPIAGSQLAKSGIANTPDLRGRFLRGLNLFYSVGEPDNFDLNSADSDDPTRTRRVNSYQGDVIRTHQHAFSHVIQVNDHEPHNSGGGFNHNAGGDEGYNNYENTDGNINAGTETRPKNVAVYYYIKIN